jgi:hypothetical protein
MSDPTSVMTIDTDALRHHRSASNPNIRPDNFVAPTSPLRGEGGEGGPESGQRTDIHLLKFQTRNGVDVVVGVYETHQMAEDAAEKFMEDAAESKLYRHDGDPPFRYTIEAKPMGKSPD